MPSGLRCYIHVLIETLTKTKGLFTLSPIPGARRHAEALLACVPLPYVLLSAASRTLVAY